VSKGSASSSCTDLSPPDIALLLRLVWSMGARSSSSSCSFSKSAQTTCSRCDTPVILATAVVTARILSLLSLYTSVLSSNECLRPLEIHCSPQPASHAVHTGNMSKGGKISANMSALAVMSNILKGVLGTSTPTPTKTLLLAELRTVSITRHTNQLRAAVCSPTALCTA
jgi:hypothetical protein